MFRSYMSQLIKLETARVAKGKRARGREGRASFSMYSKGEGRHEYFPRIDLQNNLNCSNYGAKYGASKSKERSTEEN